MSASPKTLEMTNPPPRSVVSHPSGASTRRSIRWGGEEETETSKATLSPGATVTAGYGVVSVTVWACAAGAAATGTHSSTARAERTESIRLREEPLHAGEGCPGTDVPE